MELHNQISETLDPLPESFPIITSEIPYSFLKQTAIYRSFSKVVLCTSVLLALSGCAQGEVITPQNDIPPVTDVIPRPPTSSPRPTPTEFIPTPFEIQAPPTPSTINIAENYNSKQEYLSNDERKELESILGDWKNYFGKLKTAKERYESAKKEAEKTKEYYDSSISLTTSVSNSTIVFKNLEKAELAYNFFVDIEEKARLEVIEDIKRDLKSALVQQYRFRYHLKEKQKFSEENIRLLTQEETNILQSLTIYGVPERDLTTIANNLAQEVENEHIAQQAELSKQIVEKFNARELPQVPQSIHFAYKFPGEDGVGASGIFLRNNDNKIILKSIEHALSDFADKKLEGFNLFIGSGDSQATIIPATVSYMPGSADYKNDFIDEVQTVSFDQDTEKQLEKFARKNTIITYETTDEIPELNDVILFENYDGSPTYGIVDGMDKENGYIFLKAPIGLSCEGASGSGASSLHAPDKIVGLIVGTSGKTTSINGRECSNNIVIKSIRSNFK